MSAITVPRLSPEEYLALDRQAEYKSEYYNGRMYAMSGGTRKHSLIAGNINWALKTALFDTPCLVYQSDLRMRVSPGGIYTYPDISVACSEPEFADNFADILTNPVLLVEVLSPSTEATDRGLKSLRYRRIESLQQYMLVSQTEPLVELLTRSVPGEWIVSEVIGLDAKCYLQSLNAAITMSSIYHKINFP